MPERSPWPGAERFRAQHGISLPVWDAQGFQRYRQGSAGVKDLIRIDPGYADVPYGVVRFRTQHAGLAIPRRSLPGTLGPTPLAELRPDTPLVMERRLHAHAGGFQEHEHGEWDPFEPCHGGTKADEGSCSRREFHHVHETLAKYIFVKGIPVERLYLAAVLPTMPWEQYEREAQAREHALELRLRGSVHAGIDRAVLEDLLGQKFPHRKPSRGLVKFGLASEQDLGVVDIDGVLFQATSRLSHAREQESARFDINPIALDLLDDAERIYCGVEGSVKGCSMLSEIVETGERATVLSDPSVTLWPKHAGYYGGDLRRLAELGRTREIVLVTDADWDSPRNRGAVLAQTAQLAHRLARLGASHVVIAAPPGPEKGYDDFRAAGGRLADLVVLEQRNVEDLIERLRASQRGGPGTIRTAATVAAALVNRSNLEGVATAFPSVLGDALLDERVLPPAPGEPRPASVEYEQRRGRTARERRVRRALPILKEAGVVIVHRPPILWDDGTEHPAPPQFHLPISTRPGVLGTLGDVGVPEYVLPDLDLVVFCEECGGPIEDARYSNRRFHKGHGTTKRSRERRRSLRGAEGP